MTSVAAALRNPIIYELKFPAIVRLRESIRKMKNSACPIKFG
jgi:hypothetical protein